MFAPNTLIFHLVYGERGSDASRKRVCRAVTGAGEKKGGGGSRAGPALNYVHEQEVRRRNRVPTHAYTQTITSARACALTVE